MAKKPSEVIGSLEGLSPFRICPETILPDTNVILRAFLAIFLRIKLVLKQEKNLFTLFRIRKLGGPKPDSADTFLASAVGNLTIADASTSIYAYLENTLHMKIQEQKEQSVLGQPAEEDQHLKLEILTALQWWKTIHSTQRRYVWLHTNFP